MPKSKLGPDDPLNQHVRYPIARALVRVVGRLDFLRPNHLTAAALATGLVASYLVWRGVDLAAFALLEVRMILDCADGELARAKKLSSPMGRIFDEVGDAAAYVAFLVAIGLRLHDWRLPAGLLVVGTLCALAHDFYKHAPADAHAHGFSRVFQRAQRFLFPARPIGPVRTAALSWDLGLTILHVGVFTHHLFEASIAAIAFGLTTLVLSRSIK